MDKLYVLYSGTRNTMYTNTTPHNNFWSIYLRNKYPKDKWIMTSDDMIDYFNIFRENKEIKRIDLYSSFSDDGKKINREIQMEKDRIASEALLVSNRNSGRNDQVIVDDYIICAFRSFRGEIILEYLGKDIDIALQRRAKNPSIDIEVWHDNKCKGIVYDSNTFEDILKRCI